MFRSGLYKVLKCIEMLRNYLARMQDCDFLKKRFALSALFEEQAMNSNFLDFKNFILHIDYTVRIQTGLRCKTGQLLRMCRQY